MASPPPERSDSASDVDVEERAEARWPMALAVVATAILHAFLPPELKVQPGFLFPVVVVGLLVVLILGDPGRIDRRKPWLSATTATLIGVITVVNGWSAVQLIIGILDDASLTQPDELLYSGGVVWFTNAVAFALWFWDLDRGGAAARAHQTTASPALLFPEMMHPEYVAENWYPKFVDYLSFSFATATAFSPTDVSALRTWAKLLMICESLLSLAIGGLVIARAINILQ